MKNKKLSRGDIYAVETGTYAGEMLIYIKTSADTHCFLAVPTMENRNVPFDSFDMARNTDIITYIEKAPRYVTKVSVAQYEKNEDSNNRREQLNSPDLVDCKEPSKKI